VIDSVRKGSVKPPELIEGLQLPDPRFHHLAEYVGLSQIFCGYENIDEVQRVSLFNTCSVTCCIFRPSNIFIDTIDGAT